MTSFAFCRVCLASNKKMHLIANTPLHTLFEKVSGIKVRWIMRHKTSHTGAVYLGCKLSMVSKIKFVLLQLITNDGKPDSLCCICFALLRKCWKFKEMSRKTDELLKEIINNGIRVGFIVCLWQQKTLMWIQESHGPLFFFL